MVLSDVMILNTTLDYLIGTLWMANEALLKKRIPHYDQDSTRKGHPVLSIVSKKIIGNEKIPMLVGSSQGRGADFCATKVRGDGKETWFGSLGRFNAGDFIERGGIQELSKNYRKPCLDNSEMIALNEWMTKREMI